MHIGPNRFLKTGISEIVFDIDKKILKRLIIIEKIYAKLIFCRCVSVNWGNPCKLKAIYIANHKDNIIKI